MISQILLAGAEGVLDEAEQGGLAHLVLSASTDAPAALLTNCIAVLDKFSRPAEPTCATNPAMVKNFVEETLRYDGPAKNLCRQTTAEVTVAGVTIPADSRVMVLMGSANHDERVFPRPRRSTCSAPSPPTTRSSPSGRASTPAWARRIARLTGPGCGGGARRRPSTAPRSASSARPNAGPSRWCAASPSCPSRSFPSEQVAVVRKAQASTAHLESVQHRSTRLTLATREFETDVRVGGKDDAAEGVVALTLHEIDGQPLPRWEPGAHVDLILGSAATRQYSLCGDPADQHTWRLGILRDPNGSGGSLYVHDQLRAGDTVRVRGPRNNFPLVESPRYLFIAGGIGITPILAMIRSAEAAGARWRLVYGGRQRASMAFLDELATYGDRVTVWPQDEKGFIDLDGLLGHPQPDTKVYCCGPEPLLNAVEQRCAGWPRGLPARRAVRRQTTHRARATRSHRGPPRPEPAHSHRPTGAIDPRSGGGGRHRRPVVLPGRHLRHLRDTRSRGPPRPP